MTEVQISIPHQLGKDEAMRRLAQAVADARIKYGSIVHFAEENWSDGSLSFAVGALSQLLRGTVDVTDTNADLRMQWPLLLRPLQGKFTNLLQARGAQLLTEP